ncbi:MAG: signal recognition particle protein [Deltaproteobacteria bacterium]|jgi:signal recognition particle subunit SRP54|nr:signal recognition particle protein [Deltaproteobacteria bacterium]
MFDTLYNGFKSAKAKLTGKTTLDEGNIKDALRDVRLSLLEADVEFSVVKTFLAKVQEKASGELVHLRAKQKDGKKVQVSPADHFINICHDELVELMGPVDSSIAFKKGSGITTVMMVGLQGAGKTTTTGKLARKLQKEGHKPLLVAADVYRPAAIDQLQVLGRQLGIPVYSVPGVMPPDLCDQAMKEARLGKHDVVIFDTAGRLTIDDALMEELDQIKAKTRPDNIFLVLDAMTGQDAVRTAKNFDDRLNLSGVVMTKLDGDARGGAALSVKAITGKPIKFLGIGESLDKLEEFRPEGLAGRILGFGDVVGLVKDFEEVVDEEKAEADARKILSGNFNMITFQEQIRTIKKMGSLKDILEKMPFFKDSMPGADLDDKQLDKVEAVICSMTRKEKLHPELLSNASRLRRIAQGSGTTLNDVRQIVQRFYAMRNMMKKVGKQPGLLANLPGFKQLNMLKQLRGAGGGGMDMLGDLEGGLQDLVGGGGDDDGGFPGMPRRPKGPSQAEMQARVDAKKKRREANKKAAKARKKTK